MKLLTHLISLISLATTQGFYHAICGDFNMNLDKYYPIYTQQPQAASQRVHRLFHHLLSHGYEDYTPLNLAPNLGTYRHLDTITRIDFITIPSLHTFDASLLSDAIKPARARQLGRDTRRVFKFDSVQLSNGRFAKTIRLLHKTPTLYSLRYESKWATYLIRLNNICLAYNSIFTTPASLPSFLCEGRNDDLLNLLCQETRRRVVLDRVFVDHPIRPTLLTSPDDIDKEVIDHFQNFVPITSSPPSSICDLPDRWSNAYEPLVDVDPNIFGSLMDPPYS
ncbi:unnamed protein product [Rhizophagus irregularis]|nr:unnamed protein product [Rhizophagus irregularis]